MDLAIARNIRLGGSRNVQLRVDMFNAFNTVVYNGRNTTLQLEEPDRSDREQPAVPTRTGNLVPARLKPQNAGFGAVTGAQAMRPVQAQIRFQF